MLQIIKKNISLLLFFFFTLNPTTCVKLDPAAKEIDTHFQAQDWDVLSYPPVLLQGIARHISPAHWPSIWR